MSGRDPDENACILILGQTGTRKGTVADEFLLDLARHKDEDIPNAGEHLQIFDFERNYLHPGRTIRSFISQTPLDRHHQWTEACDELARHVDDSGAKHTAVLLHGLYWYQGELFTNARTTLLQRLRPTLVVTLVDDIYDIQARIYERELNTPTGARVSLAQLITWRWTEIAIGDLISRNVRDQPIPNLVFAIKHSARTLRQLLLDRRRLPVYASFPITKVRTPGAAPADARRQLQEEIGDFRREMRAREFTVLDPTTIDEYRLLDEPDPDGSYLRPRWELADAPMVPAEELHPVTRAELAHSFVRETLRAELDVQLSRRDFRMIDGAQIVAAYRPRAFTGEFSRGTNAELHYAAATGKEARWVELKEDRALAREPDRSPFAGIGEAEAVAVPHESAESLLDLMVDLQQQRAQLVADGNEPKAWTLRANRRIHGKRTF